MMSPIQVKLTGWSLHHQSWITASCLVAHSMQINRTRLIQRATISQDC